MKILGVKSTLACFSAALIALATGVSATQLADREVVDRIAVIVGNEVILASEIGNQMQMIALQSGQRPNSEKEMQKLQADVIDQMVSDRLFLLAARKDTSLSVRKEEVDQALDDQIQNIAANFGSEDEFTSALAAEGLTLRDLKKKYRTDIENQLLKQRFIQNKLYSVSVSRYEVEQFFEEFRDSIPVQPEALRLAHILLEIKPSIALEDSVRQLAASLRQRILDGEDFAAISTEYSSMGAGANGGDLGFVSRNDVVDEFARAAFSLPVGGISGVIRTEFGYHVIRCEGQKDERLHLRHLLLAVQPSAADTAAAFASADSLIERARNGEDFALLAKEYSADNSTRGQGGELGWIATNDAPSDIRPYVTDYTTPGEIRGPIPTPSGLHILKLLEYSPEKQYSLKDDYDQIKELARQDKTGRMVDKWIDELKEKTFIEYRMDEDAN